MDNYNENLKELISQFMDSKKADVFLDDFEAGDRLFRQYPAPKPDDMLIANIKANIALGAKPQKHSNTKHLVFRGLAVAASIIIVVSMFLNPQPPKSSLPEGFWNNGTDLEVAAIDAQLKQVVNRLIEPLLPSDTNYEVADAEIIAIENDIEQVKDYLVAVDSQEDYYYDTSLLDELESRLDNIDNNSFWNDNFDTEFEEIQNQTY